MNAQNAFQFLAGEAPAPKLGQPLNLLDLLFERMPMGIAILDRNFRIHRYNPTWGDFARRYAPPTGVPLRPGVGYFEHLPGTEAIVLPLFERALAGETVRVNGVRLQSDEVVTYWDVVLAPLLEKDQILGMLNVAVDVTDRILLQQNLEERVTARTRELQVLLAVSAAANSSLELDETLNRTLDLIASLVAASRAGVLLLDERTGELIPHNLRPEPIVHPSELLRMIAACKAVIASGETAYLAPDPEQGRLEPGALLPLQSRGKGLGVLVIIGPQGGGFTPAQLTLFQSIAEQLGAAIENARFFEEAEQAAIAAERNRLARDLHDAVTQTLFSSNMIADVLPRIWERSPEEGRRRLEELRQLTRGALSEMRTLLVELRPAALVDTDLGDLIGHQVNAFIARTRLPVAYNRHGAHNTPVEVKEAFYRIAQEALNNIAKHAEASQVRLELACQPGRVALLLHDNGIGFDPHSPSREGLGLGIMRERANSVGARLEIQSEVHGGTRLRMSWAAPRQEAEHD